MSRLTRTADNVRRLVQRAFTWLGAALSRYVDAGPLGPGDTRKLACELEFLEAEPVHRLVTAAD